MRTVHAFCVVAMHLPSPGFAVTSAMELWFASSEAAWLLSKA